VTNRKNTELDSSLPCETVIFLKSCAYFCKPRILHNVTGSWILMSQEVGYPAVCVTIIIEPAIPFRVIIDRFRSFSASFGNLPLRLLTRRLAHTQRDSVLHPPRLPRAPKSSCDSYRNAHQLSVHHPDPPLGCGHCHSAAAATRSLLVVIMMRFCTRLRIPRIQF